MQLSICCHYDVWCSIKYISEYNLKIVGYSSDKSNSINTEISSDLLLLNLCTFVLLNKYIIFKIFKSNAFY